MSRIDKVSVAILSWNGRAHLEVCLPALRQQIDPGVEWEVLVLDNGSSDGTVEWVRQHHPQVRLIESPHNLGFCAGNNRLIDEASGDAVALLNNDTRPRPEWLAALVDGLRSAPADVAAVSGQIVDWAGERLDFARAAMTFDGHAFQLDFGQPLDQVQIPAAGSELAFACGGNMLIRRSSYLAAGGFDADYFAYLEDVDLGWRLWSGGERVLLAPEAVVHHRSMATSDLLGHNNRGFLFERNAFLTAYKNYEEGLWQKIMPAVQLTLMHRTQTMMVQSNPGGEQLTFDPYAGLIANTCRESRQETVFEGESALLAGEPAEIEAKGSGLAEKWRQYGSKEFVRRGLAKAKRSLLPSPRSRLAPGTAALTDGRTVAQLRALTYLLGNLDRSAAKRRVVQARRQRSDLEIFERFPLYLVPTYPGDERLFATEAFAEWLPKDLPIKRRRLDQIMKV